jgi:hypothetical protein
VRVGGECGDQRKSIRGSDWEKKGRRKKARLVRDFIGKIPKKKLALPSPCPKPLKKSA